MTAHRILTIAHGHPDFSKGGGELAAYNLHRAYSAAPGVEATWFLARAERGRGPSGRIVHRRENEFLWEQGMRSFHEMKALNQFELHGYFTELIQTLKPTVVHVHHYVFMGLEFLRIIKKIDPSIKLVMTLHEYIAICANSGQMVKTGTNRLCYASGYDDCHQCFPDKTPEDFWLRRHFFVKYFDLVDQFVAPSDFLRQRYIDWGLAPERIVTIENGQPRRDPLPPRPLAPGETRNRFAYFGQINQFKGIEILLRGLAGMTRTERKGIVLEIHGANLDVQTQDFQDRINALRAPLEAERTLYWIGPYEPRQMTDRLRNIDWVVVPSIWWENSPLVIQEAFAHGRPVIASDIGGMAEKVVNGVNGRHVDVGNAHAWGQTMKSVAADTVQWDRLHQGISPPLSHEDCAAAHLALV
ncbi:glycosyltransferase family 4 protein [Ruixingdingia sedimenti]|uniref:Glycosyltransferase family 4 protein n=1 Tax=Ruixingdingia sedimenti TaxID=3073604 RepID=A0ABU1FDG2_9RHOB|nr:glycosyltransferase family 4 protein [Xinfangfangia sp. LG-4]MDR5654437.1 glycosyltransferase family 4 protein [Xinfangfangia sp. LG-4]